MNSDNTYQEVIGYQSKRGDNQRLIYNQQLEIRRGEFMLRSKEDRKFTEILTPVEHFILNDKLHNGGKPSQDIQNEIANAKLPFLNNNPQSRSIKQKKKSDQSMRTYTMASTTLRKAQTLAGFKKLKKEDIEKLIIQPDGAWKLAWDLLCMILIFYEILNIPFQLSFNIEVSQDFEYFADSVFMFDILITFNTAIYLAGQLTTSHKQIALTYLKLWFWIDLAASFPYNYIMDYVLTGSTSDSAVTDQSQSSTNGSGTTISQSTQLLKLLKFFRFIKIMRLLRLAKLKVILDKVEDVFQLSSTMLTIVSFLKLSFFVLFWSHWLGCIFHFIAQQEDPAKNWLTIYNLYDLDWTVRYVNSIYWAVTTMTTVGYGDLSPQTPLERLAGIFFLLVACSVFSFTMNSIGNTMQQNSVKRDMFKKRITEINNYMSRVEIPKHLQHKIRRYLQYKWDFHRNMDLAQITENLSQTLKYELTIQVNGSILSICPCFINTFSEPLLIELTQIIHEQILQPDEYVFQEDGQKNLENLYLIQDGIVNIILQKTNQIIEKLESKKVFGEINFFGNVPRTASAKSVDFTDVFYVTRSSFLKLLTRFPEDQEKFFQIQQEIIANDLSSIGIFCYACDMLGHVVKDCPTLHFVVDKYLFFKTKTRCLQHIMKQFRRRDRVDFNARYYNKYIYDRAKPVKGTNAMYNSVSEDCNILDDVMNVDKQQVQRVTKLRSKFKEDAVKKKRFQSFLHNQSKAVTSLLKKQEEQFAITKQLSSNFTRYSFQTQHGAYEEDSDEDQEHLQEKFDEMLKDYGIFKGEMNKYNGNQNSDGKQLFSTLSNFDKGADYVNYYPHNNLEIVIREINLFNFGKEVKPLIETEYDSYAFQEYIDYYQIDYDAIMRFKFDISQQALKHNQDFTTAANAKLPRSVLNQIIQDKKIKEVDKKTQENIQIDSEFSQSSEFFLRIILLLLFVFNDYMAEQQIRAFMTNFKRKFTDQQSDDHQFNRLIQVYTDYNKQTLLQRRKSLDYEPGQPQKPMIVKSSVKLHEFAKTLVSKKTQNKEGQIQKIF